jgi:peptide/nickel transport system substrate-binding protein
MNSEMDAALEAAQVENDPKARAALWHKIAAIEMRELPDLPLVAVSRLTVHKKTVRAHTESPVGPADSFADTWIEK